MPYNHPIPDEFKEDLQKIIDSVDASDEPSKGWEFYSEQEGVKMYKKYEGSNLAFLGVITLNYPKEEIYDLLQEPADRNLYDDMFDKGSIIKKFTEHFKVTQMCFKGRTLVSGRDFALMNFTTLQDDGSIMIYIGNLSPEAEKEYVPVTSSYVRGTMFYGCYKLKPIEENKTEVTFMTCMSVNGYVPQWVGNLVLTDQPMTLAAVAKYLNNFKGEYKGAPYVNDENPREVFNFKK